MNKLLKEILISDFRRTGFNLKPGLKGTFKIRMLYPEYNFLYNYRKACFYINSSKNFILKQIWKLKWNSLRQKNGMQISLNTKIGQGLHLHHFGRIIIVSSAIIGNNCNISTGVVVGFIFKGKRQGAPKIGNKVFIGANSVIVGNVTVGDNVVIAPNTFINFDVPSNSVVLGSPGKIIPKENPSENYCFNCI